MMRALRVFFELMKIFLWLVTLMTNSNLDNRRGVYGYSKKCRLKIKS
jgi:hypothetical protein